MGGAWVFPGGSLADDRETHAACAVRELQEEAGVSVAENALVGFSRWITPKDAPKRFDTMFFVTPAPEDQTPEADGSECVQVSWQRPQDALARHGRGELELVFPTIKQLEQLAKYGSVEAVLEGAPGSSVEPITPRVVSRGGQREIVLPGEEGYDSSP
jgi:8-oxo-dGTP pyrophosphatase MutT (NUDIX family)